LCRNLWGDRAPVCPKHYKMGCGFDSFPMLPQRVPRLRSSTLGEMTDSPQTLGRRPKIANPKSKIHTQDPKSPLSPPLCCIAPAPPMSQTYQAKVYVTLRPSVLDPAGTAVQSGLQHLGYDNVGAVRIGKYVELTLTAADESEAHAQVDRMCDQLLANPVIENYRFELTPSP